MKRYRVKEIYNMVSGMVGLDDHQALLRVQSLKKVHDGVYDILKPICFKRGEVIKLPFVDGSDRYTQDCLELIDVKKPDGPPAPVESYEPKPEMVADLKSEGKGKNKK